jgi:hypothetical protein
MSKPCPARAHLGTKNSQFRHGLSYTSEYRIWASMVGRTSNPNTANYKYYGAKGILLCERWRDAAVFYADMGPRPSPGHSLERVDNSRGYEPGNCVWATAKTQARNKSWTTRCSDGVALSDRAESIGVSPSLAKGRWRYLERKGCKDLAFLERYALHLEKPPVEGLFRVLRSVKQRDTNEQI